jgi:hypothetical protein
MDLISKHPLHRNNPTRVPLSRAIDHSHATAPDFFQDLVITEAPLCVGHVRFYEDAFERLTGRLGLGFKSGA